MADILQDDVSQFGTGLLPDLVWSYSKLDGFETCPKRYAALNVWKSHREPDTGRRSEALVYGDQVHAEMNRYVRQGVRPSPGQYKFMNVVDHVIKDAKSVQAELKVGITRALRYTAFFNDDVALRVILDLLVERKDNVGLVIDWKTSSQPRETPLQLKLSALAALVMKPWLDKVLCAFVYTDHPTKKEELRRDDIQGLLDELGPRLGRLEDALRRDDFPARECWACRFCPVRECVFNRTNNR